MAKLPITMAQCRFLVDGTHPDQTVSTNQSINSRFCDAVLKGFSRVDKQKERKNERAQS